MSLINLLPECIEEIIFSYKNTFEEIEKKNKKNLKKLKSIMFDNFNYHTSISYDSIKFNIMFEDLKSFLIKNDIYNIRYQLIKNGESDFKDFNLIHNDDSSLINLLVVDFAYSFQNDILYIKFHNNEEFDIEE